jgi:subtilisin-like proprotein convertase family protein
MRGLQSNLVAQRDVEMRSDCGRRAFRLGRKVRVAFGVLVVVLAGVVAGTDAGAVAPLVPPGCGTPIVTSDENTTPVVIPTGPAVVTSTIDVSGAGAHLTDVNLFTNITHTFSADLDITLQSPAGTVVTITTDNGGGNDNTFAGTTFDDQANPGGQVPYVTNPGLTTDNPYANNVVATPLAPEEALAAFAGEDPNGTWTLTISDDLAGDGGALNNWRLDVTTGLCPPPPPLPASPPPPPAPATTPESPAPAPASPTPTPESPTTTPKSPSLRLHIARLSVFGPGATARCLLTTGRIDLCRVRLRARGHVLARGTRSAAHGANSLRVRLRLTAYGRGLLGRRLGGMRGVATATDGTRTATARTRAILAVERLTTPPGAWAPDKSALTQTGRRFLRTLRGRLIGVSSYRCEGDTASSGPASADSKHALALSLARAKLVCGALRRFGATGKQSLVARAGTDPIAPNTTAAGRAKNRRVEVTLRH